MVPWAHPSPQPRSISLAISAGLTAVTYQQTDHTTQSVTTGHIYVCSSTMRPNNVKLKTNYKCGPMLNVMAALPNIGGALCSVPQRLADGGRRLLEYRAVTLPRPETR